MKELKSAQIITRVTEDDRAWVNREADRHGLDPSSFIRMTLRKARTETPVRAGASGPSAREAS